jgi:hypothetical protein
MIKNPPQIQEALVGETESSGSGLSGSTSILGSYELLKREGEIHLGRTQIVEDLRANVAKLEDLHGKLQFLLGEVETILRR